MSERENTLENIRAHANSIIQTAFLEEHRGTVRYIVFEILACATTIRSELDIKFSMSHQTLQQILSAINILPNDQQQKLLSAFDLSPLRNALETILAAGMNQEAIRSQLSLTGTFSPQERSAEENARRVLQREDLALLQKAADSIDTYRCELPKSPNNKHDLIKQDELRELCQTDRAVMQTTDRLVRELQDVARKTFRALNAHLYVPRTGQGIGETPLDDNDKQDIREFLIFLKGFLDHYSRETLKRCQEPVTREEQQTSLSYASGALQYSVTASLFFSFIRRRFPELTRGVDFDDIYVDKTSTNKLSAMGSLISFMELIVEEQKQSGNKNDQYLESYIPGFLSDLKIIVGIDLTSDFIKLSSIRRGDLGTSEIPIRAGPPLHHTNTLEEFREDYLIREIVRTSSQPSISHNIVSSYSRQSIRGRQRGSILQSMVMLPHPDSLPCVVVPNFLIPFADIFPPEDKMVSHANFVAWHADGARNTQDFVYRELFGEDFNPEELVKKGLRHFHIFEERKNDKRPWNKRSPFFSRKDYILYVLMLREEAEVALPQEILDQQVPNWVAFLQRKKLKKKGIIGTDHFSEGKQIVFFLIDNGPDDDEEQAPSPPPDVPEWKQSDLQPVSV